MIYQFRSGSRMAGVSAQKIGEALAKIRERYGMLETETVVRLAENQRSSLHGAFEWNNKKAGHEFRLIQARHMIRALTITVEDTDEPAYVHVEIDHTNYYQSTEIACKNVEELELVRAHAVRLLQSASQSLDDLENVAIRVNFSGRTKFKRAKKAVSRATEDVQHA